MNGESESLRISIPAKENYFKISRESKPINPGTTFRVFVLKDKLPKDEKTSLPIEMNFTDYVSKVAAFCKFPIVIKERQKSVMIVNPNHPNNDETTTIRQLSYSFPCEKSIQLPYINETKEYFQEKLIHLKKDLGLDTYDGCITYLVPKNENIDIANIGHFWPIQEVRIMNDMVEMIDSYFLQLYQNVQVLPSATINTKSPGWAIDRLSILHLKIYHMENEANRMDADDTHHLLCTKKLEVLQEQLTDLSTAIDQLLEDIQLGQKYMKVYKQMKMYNDPMLNPVLYANKNK